MKLNKNELKKVKGGFSIWAVIGAVAGIIFGIGGVDGYARPVPCRK